MDNSLAADSVARSEPHRTIATIDSMMRSTSFDFDTLGVRDKKSAAEASTEHTATTRLYNPPNGTAVAIITILVIGCLIYVFYRKR